MPFAAGCAICGADLDMTRFDHGPGPLQRVGSWLGAISYGPRVSIPTALALLAAGYLLLQIL